MVPRGRGREEVVAIKMACVGAITKIKEREATAAITTRQLVKLAARFLRQIMRGLLT